MNPIDLPWPYRGLSPNARLHWAKKARLMRTYRIECFLLTRASDFIPPPKGKILLVLEFIQPDKRRRDDDNLIASFKAGRDGVADALRIDDSRFVTQFHISDETTKGGRVRMTLREISG